MQTVKIWWQVTSVIFIRAMESTKAAFGTFDTRSIQCVVVSTKRQFALGRRRTRLIFMPFIAEMDKAERGGERSIYYSSMSTALAVTEGICIPMTINDSEKPFSQWNRRWIKSFLSPSTSFSLLQLQYVNVTSSSSRCTTCQGLFNFQAPHFHEMKFAVKFQSFFLKEYVWQLS